MLWTKDEINEQDAAVPGASWRPLTVVDRYITSRHRLDSCRGLAAVRSSMWTMDYAAY